MWDTLYVYIKPLARLDLTDTSQKGDRVTNLFILLSAILELYQTVDFFQDIKPICMPESETGSNILATNNLDHGFYFFEEAHLAGWAWDGVYDNNGNL